MPRLFHRPPKYRLHKSTNQAIVSFNGKKIHLRPYGSERSHQKYQEILKQWQEQRHQQRPATAEKATSEEVVKQAITTETLRDKRRHGLPISIDELVLVYRRHARSSYAAYDIYRTNGTLTHDRICGIQG